MAKQQIWRGGVMIEEIIEAAPVTTEEVRAEAQRRIIALTGARDMEHCIVRQLNALMRAGELVRKEAMSGLTPEEAVEAGQLQGLADGVKAIRAASNVMEPAPPADYDDDARWSIAPG